MNNKFIKTDNNIIVNENTIRWVKKVNECMEICSKFNGCFYRDTLEGKHEMLKVCKTISPESYKKLNEYFDN